ncbi:MAG TPA: hypothetical protein PKH77_27030 [Anaerolineae bacterium]|nr:hypothetical protein [Anaerolineae bacterium]
MTIEMTQIESALPTELTLPQSPSKVILAPRLFDPKPFHGPPITGCTEGSHLTDIAVGLYRIIERIDAEFY